MSDHDQSHDHINAVAYRDILMNTILGLVIMFAFAIIMMVQKQAAEAAQADPPGNLIVHILWPEGDTDIDLWVSGPAEPVPVGYSNKGGVLWNLLRDDLGDSPDATPINYEDAFTRGVVPGEYTINVHCYRCPSLPQKVDVEVSINTGDPGEKSGLKVLVTTSVNLVSPGQERTAINFILNADGTIRPGSMNSVFRPLRSAQKSGRVLPNL